MKNDKCTICDKKITGFGNNAYPITDGRCCNDCNTEVIMARLKLCKKDKANKIEGIIKAIKKGLEKGGIIDEELVKNFIKYLKQAGVI